jgi:pimeloyl-ACP methyl ester carboxylesterase
MSFYTKQFALILAATALITTSAEAQTPARNCSTPATRAGHYAQVNGLRLYYELHGPAQGTPVVLLHGALSNIQNSFGKLLPTLSCTHRVIAVEYQAHGHTAEIDRTLTTSQIADDVSELLRQLRVEQADLIGYSMGGLSALQFAVRHPAQLRRLVVISAGSGQSTWAPEIGTFMLAIDPNDAPWSDGFRAEFQKVNPRPDAWPATLARVKESFQKSGDVTAAQLAAITHPVLLIDGDRDAVPLDHILQFYRALPKGQLAVLPGTDHYPGVADRMPLIGTLVAPFLAAPAQ